MGLSNEKVPNVPLTEANPIPVIKKNSSPSLFCIPLLHSEFRLWKTTILIMAPKMT